MGWQRDLGQLQVSREVVQLDCCSVILKGEVTLPHNRITTEEVKEGLGF